MRRIVLLPGMDGTGLLYRDFVRHTPAGFAAEVVPLPPEPLAYAEPAGRVAPRIAPGCIVMGIRIAVARGLSGRLSDSPLPRLAIRGNRGVRRTRRLGEDALNR